MRKRIGLFVVSMIAYEYADRAISYLLHKGAAGGHSWGTMYAAVWAGLVFLGLLAFACEAVFLRRMGRPQWWPLPILAASVLGSFIMLWQGHVDSRIAFAVYFVPVLILLFTKKRTGDQPTAASADPKNLGTRAS